MTVEWKTSAARLPGVWWMARDVGPCALNIQRRDEGGYVIRHDNSDWAKDPPLAGPFDTLEAAKAAYILLAGINNC